MPNGKASYRLANANPNCLTKSKIDYLGCSSNNSANPK